MKLVIDKSIIGNIKDFLKGKKLLFSLRVNEDSITCQIYDNYLVQWVTPILSKEGCEVGDEVSFNLQPILTLLDYDEDLCIDLIANTVLIHQSNFSMYTNTEFEKVAKLDSIDKESMTLFDNSKMKSVMRICRIASAIAKEQSISSQPPIFVGGRFLLKYDAMAYYTPMDFDDCILIGEILNTITQNLGTTKGAYYIDGDKIIFESKKYKFMMGLDRNSSIYMENDSIKRIEKLLQDVCSINISTVAESGLQLTKIIKKQLVTINIYKNGLSINTENDGAVVSINPISGEPLYQGELSVAQLQVLLNIFKDDDTVSIKAGGRYLCIQNGIDNLILPVLI